MKLIYKDFIVGSSVIGKIPFYAEVEPELAVMKKGDRVLPAPFFYEKRVYFEFFERHEPGEKHWPNGGIVVVSHDGAKHYYDLDQVILHPHMVKHKKTLEKMMRKANEERGKREKKYEKALKETEKTIGKRGRKPLSPEERARKDQEKMSRAERSGGKRGRPKSSGVSKPPKLSTGKRGRRPLSPELKAAREVEKAAKRLITGGRRGRPAKRK